MKKSKKLVAVIFTSLFLMAISVTAATFKNGKVIMLVSIEVKNFFEWKKGFDTGTAVREKAGIKVLSVCSSIENENQIVVIEEAENAQVAQDFLTLLKSKQKEGNMSKLDVKLYDKVE